jgi:hypothetical protein
MSFLRTGRAASFAAAVLVLAACEQQPLATPASARMEETERVSATAPLDVQAATLEWLIANKTADGIDAYCVSTGYPDLTEEPSASLLERFAGRKPALVPLSECTVDVSGITWNQTGGFAEWLKVGEPQVRGAKATLPAAFQLNGRLFEAYACEAKRHQGAWTVTDCVLVAAG